MKKILMLIVIILIFSIIGYLGYQYFQYYKSQKSLEEFISKIDELYNKFNQIERRASSTMRVALSPVVGEMQDILFELDKIDCPDYAIECKSNLKKYFNIVIEAYIQFMSMNESTSKSLLEQAIFYKTQFLTSREALIKKH